MYKISASFLVIQVADTGMTTFAVFKNECSYSCVLDHWDDKKDGIRMTKKWPLNDKKENTEITPLDGNQFP